MGIGCGKGGLANQIWLLAEDVDAVLRGGTFARYILKDEATNDAHPESYGILYVSLQRLAREETPAGEPARFLLGETLEPEDETVRKIADAFKNSFNEFKSEKGVTDMLSLAERYTAEGEVIGIAIGANAIAELIKSGMPPEQALAEINKQLKESASLDNTEPV